MRTFFSTLLFGGVLLGASAAEAAEADHPAKLLALLRSPDQPVTREALAAVGPASEGLELVAIAADRTLDRYTRMRAASSLGWVDRPAIREVLIELAEGRATDDVEVRVQAITTLSGLEKEDAYPRLARWLTASQIEVREAAIRGLARIKLPAARVMLEARQGAETDPRLRALLVRTLTGSHQK